MKKCGASISSPTHTLTHSKHSSDGAQKHPKGDSTEIHKSVRFVVTKQIHLSHILIF